MPSSRQAFNRCGSTVRIYTRSRSRALSISPSERICSAQENTAPHGDACFVAREDASREDPRARRRRTHERRAAASTAKRSQPRSWNRARD
jgi:hypothetical protein